MEKQPRREEKPADKSRTDQAREVAEAYAADLREFIKKLGRKLN